MAFYAGDAFPGWRGNLLLAGLASQTLARLSIEGRRVTGEERIRIGTRIRHVVPGPDGFVYLLTDEDNGRVLRLSPAGGAR
jgi:glucose/arabinose dehydrogenase